MITKSTIDKVFEAARLEEVIGDFVQLKKAGSNFKGLSPFSDERTPSFMVSPVKQIWKDFSSGKGGNVVAFLMEHEHFTYPEAIKYLAKKYNIEIEETQQTNEEKEQASERESLYIINQYACSYFEKIMLQTETGKAIGLSYFKERGFTNSTIKTFNLGYALNQWQAFTDEALKQGYQLEYLEKTGLTIVKEDNYFDRFKGRVIFPIHSMSGRILGFGGRILTNDKKAAKYLNSPESEIYHKSKILYGIFQAKKSIAKKDNCYLVEGYTDVIQMHQKGVENVVASSGTALTANQIRLVNRLTKNITVLFDGDAAGLRASIRGIDLILEQGMNVKVCLFPEGEDPDSFAKTNTLEEIQEYLTENAQDFIQFKANLLKETSANDPIKRAETIRDIVTSISKIPDRIKTEIYIKECAKIMHISEEVLFSTLAQISKKEVQNFAKKQKENEQSLEIVKEQQTLEKVDIQYELERKIIEILILYGTQTEEFEDLILKENENNELILVPEKLETTVFEKVYLDLQDDEMEFTNNNFKKLYYTIIDTFHQNPNYESHQFVNELEPEIAVEITSILMENERYQLADWERKNIFPKNRNQTIAQLVSETILNLRCHLIEQKVNEFKNQTLSKPEEEHEKPTNNSTILQNVKDYSGLKMLLSKKLNRVI